jgi:general secretion pathway protein C
VNVAAVINAHLFGFEPPPPPTPKEAEPTALRLVLSGTLATPDPSKGGAILGPGPASTKVYFVDQPVPGGARLHAIYPDRVVLERNGVLEALYLPRNRLPGMPASRQAETVASVTTDFGETTDHTEDSRREALKYARRAVVQEHPQVDQLIRPLARAGEFRGVEIAPLASVAAFEQLGLQTGDVLIAVNGAQLQNTQAGFAAIRSLDTMPEAHLTVIRDGTPHEIVLHTAQINADAQTAMADSGLPPDTGEDN